DFDSAPTHWQNPLPCSSNPKTSLGDFRTSGLLAQRFSAKRFTSPQSEAAIFHMWTAPSLQGVLQCFDQIACVHMSGLFCALAHERWPRWFPRQEFQTEGRTHRGPLENAEFLSSWIDRSHHLL